MKMINQKKLKNGIEVVGRDNLNKLAHGDYQIKENEIILEINDKIGSVNIDRLLDLTIQLDQNLSLIQKQKENTVGMIRNKNALENINIKTKSDLDKALSNMSYVEIKEKPRKLSLRTKEYIALAINLKVFRKHLLFGR